MESSREAIEKKKKRVNEEYDKCKKIIEKSLTSKQYEKAMAAISIGSFLLYSWNQRYTDESLENAIGMVAERTMTPEMEQLMPEGDVVIFYDSFGLDTRGLALIYLKALANLGREVVYVTVASAENNQPEIDKAIEGAKIRKKYFSSHKHFKKLQELQRIICDIKPSKAFLYTTPNDSAGVAVFMQMRNVARYQINLTDHAFWLGTHAFDYCLEFRNYGAGVSRYYRGIAEEKIRAMPYYPAIDKDEDFQGLPFEPEGRKIIFSGGSIYKTIDKDGTFYQIVREILKNNEDTVFLYAGYGDNTYIEELKEIYIGRVYHIPERKDLYQLMQHITLYLNTYPLLGGLMMQYAAIAGKIPITLWHGSENGGILIGQEDRKVEYGTAEELISDVNRLLREPDYLKQRERLLEGSIIEEKEFETELNRFLVSGKTKYTVKCDVIETDQFRREYIERFDIDEFLKEIAGKSNISLLMEYKNSYIKRIREGVYEDCSDGNFAVSVLVAAYEPSIRKLLVTINSALSQKGVSFQIVVTDDGSGSFDPVPVLEYFEKKNFHNYIITSLQHNRGTVRNVYNGLQYCRGKYTKLISPGDYLYGERILGDWLECINGNNAAVCFADCIHYRYNGDRLEPISVASNPQRTGDFYEGSWAYNYLIFNDLVTGACMLTDTETLKRYIDIIKDKVIYADDNVYRLMAYNGERACYLQKNAMLYEHGIGISTGGDNVWSKRIRDDWNAADDIMLGWEACNKLQKNFRKKAAHIREANSLKRKMRAILIDGYLLNYIRRKKLRLTGLGADEKYVEHIHKI